MNPWRRLQPRLMLLIVFGLLAGPAMPALAAHADENRKPAIGREQTARYIVALADNVAADDVIGSSVSRGGFVIIQRYTAALNGFAAELTETAASALRNDPRVTAVMPDVQFHAAEQTTPTGIRRVFATESDLAAIDGIDERVDVDVAVLDSGVGPHPDLNVVGGTDCTGTGGGSYDDNNGHGTHVAGTLAALDNDFGVVGVAPGARIWSIKVLDSSNTGTGAWILCGIDWVTANAATIDVVNMSITAPLPYRDDNNCGKTNGDVFHQAICASVAAGVTWVVAAGNEGVDANEIIPAQYDEVITVSALDDADGLVGNDTLASFSNYGADIDLIAPGVSIYSTALGGGYENRNGTSMSSPHVAGGAALYKATYPTAPPDEVAAALKAAGNTTTWSGDRDSYKEPLLDVSTFDGRARIDAQVLAVSAPAAVVRGQSVTVRAEIRNNSDATKLVRVVFRESPGGALQTSALELGVNATGSVTFIWATHAWTALGEHTLTVATTLVGDRDAGNDSMSVTTTIVSGATTDAQVVSVGAPASAQRGQNVTVTAQIRNNSSTSKAIPVKFKEAPGGVTQTTSITLAAGATGVVSFTWATSASTTLGTHTFTITTSLAGDTTPGNNSGSAKTNVVQGTTVDAQVLSVSAPVSATRGQSVIVSAQIRNNSSATKAVPVTFKEAPGGATQSKSITLAAGATGVVSFTWVTSATTTLGTHTFTITTMLAGDTVTSNNTGTATTNITSGRGR